MVIKITLKELEAKVEKLRKQIDKQHDTVMNLFDLFKLRARGRKRKEMIQIIQSQLW